ncbi:MAG TPA: T9SS type A sorting domain-containing protein [Chitinophagaceae bacterium]|nr:T9SS type A sorting domain-containing protein [Chitinophagaceae bacterium]
MKKICLISVLLVSLFSTYAQNQTNNTPTEKGTLPVMFDSVRANVKDDLVQISWSNLTEREVKYYMIERSVNGTDFMPIYQQPPSRNLDDKASYTYVDTKPVAGPNFYRIKVAIINGRMITSRILRAEMDFTTPGFTLYPNPVTGDECTISLASERKGKYTLEIVNSSGLCIQQVMLSNQGNGISQAISLPAGTRPGVYVVRIKGEEYTASQLLVKK